MRIILAITDAGIVARYQVRRRKNRWSLWRSWLTQYQTPPHRNLGELLNDLSTMLSPMWQPGDGGKMRRAERKRIAKTFAAGACRGRG